MVVLPIFDVTQEIWYFHVRFESINMPRYFMHVFWSGGTNSLVSISNILRMTSRLKFLLIRVKDY